MATWYVSKSGSDANPGTEALPFLTISKGCQSAVSGDEIVIGAGIYYEEVYIGPLNGRTLTLRGTGRVVIDGEGVRQFCLTSPNGTTVHYHLYGLHFRGAVTRLVNLNSGSACTMRATDCVFEDSPQVVRNASSTSGVRLTRCIVRNIYAGGGLDAAVYTSTGIAEGDQGFYYCLFVDVAGDTIRSTQTTYSFLGNIWRNCDVFFTSNAAQSGRWDYNVYDLAGTTGAGWIIGTTNYATLATWRGALPAGSELNSVEAVADFLDYDNRLYLPTPGGNLYTQFADLGKALPGPYAAGFGLSNNRNADLWAGGTFAGTALDGSGHLVLTDTVGTYTTPVVDLGAAVRLQAVIIPITGESYPTTVVDADTNDANPNHATVEMRYSTVNAAAVEAAAWQTVRLGVGAAVMLDPQPAARWVQLRVTLRNNGVAA